MTGQGIPAVRFILAWQRYRVGDVIRPSGTTRDWLMQRGYVELVRDDDDTVETTMAEPQTEKAVKRGRGRPKGSKNKPKKVLIDGTS